VFNYVRSHGNGGYIPVQTSTARCDEWFGDSGVAVQEITVPVVKDAINCVPRGCGIRLINKNFASSGSQGILSKKPASPVISLFDFGSNLPMFLSPWKL